ncbi:hypothetical protein [Streptomyces sp. NPDC005890]
MTAATASAAPAGSISFGARVGSIGGCTMEPAAVVCVPSAVSAVTR